MTRFLLVELDGGLDHSRHVGLWCALRTLPGVRSVADLSVVSPETLSTILLQPEPETPSVVAERVQQLTF